MKKRIEDLKIITTKRLQGNFLFLELQSDYPFEEIKPGQFVEIRVDGCKDTFLRRPISIHDVDYQNNSLKFLIKIVGCGTETLSKKKKDQTINVVYPLGNGFSVPTTDKVLFVGGGYGIAPFYFFAKQLKKLHIKPHILLGARTKEDFILLEQFEDLGILHLTTNDGSLGYKGLVTEHPVLEENKNYFKKIYSCGPEPMMKAVAAYSLTHTIDCEVSLDNLMACGIGACLCCITPTVRGNEIVCTQGPVFNVADLVNF